MAVDAIGTGIRNVGEPNENTRGPIHPSTVAFAGLTAYGALPAQTAWPDSTELKQDAKRYLDSSAQHSESSSSGVPPQADALPAQVERTAWADITDFEFFRLYRGVSASPLELLNDKVLEILAEDCKKDSLTGEGLIEAIRVNTSLNDLKEQILRYDGDRLHDVLLAANKKEQLDEMITALLDHPRLHRVFQREYSGSRVARLRQVCTAINDFKVKSNFIFIVKLEENKFTNGAVDLFYALKCGALQPGDCITTDNKELEITSYKDDKLELVNRKDKKETFSVQLSMNENMSPRFDAVRMYTNSNNPSQNIYPEYPLQLGEVMYHKVPRDTTPPPFRPTSA